MPQQTQDVQALLARIQELEHELETLDATRSRHIRDDAVDRIIQDACAEITQIVERSEGES